MNLEAQTEVDTSLAKKFKITRQLSKSINIKRAKHYFNALVPLIRPRSRLLDLGAGSEMLSQMLGDHLELDVVALDVVDRSLVDLNIVQYDGRNIPLPDKSIDVSICVSVLHHTKDPVCLLKELKRVSRERVIIVEDRFNSWFDRLSIIGLHKYLELVESMSYEADQFRSTDQWCKLLNDLGMEIEHLSYFPPLQAWFLVHNLLLVVRP